MNKRYLAGFVSAVLLAVALHVAPLLAECVRSETSGNCVTCDQGYAEMMDQADANYAGCSDYSWGSCYLQWTYEAGVAVAWLTWCEGTSGPRVAGG